MRYRRLIMENYRGVGYQEVEFSPGITVISGPNEVGKSSIREALSLLRKLKDSSRKEEIRDVVPVGKDVGPRVYLELETGPYKVTYEKQWLKGRKTELAVDDGKSVQTYTSDEAHAKFLELLEETVDTDLLEQLDVGQGSSLDQARLANLTALHQALGENPEDAVSDSLMDAVEAEYRRYYTPKGATTGELKAAVASLEAADAELAEAEAAQSAVEGYVAELEEKEESVAALAAWLADARKKLEELKRQEESARALRKDLADVEGAAKQAEMRVGELNELLESRAKDQEELKAETEELRNAQKRLELEEEQLERAEAAWREARTSHREAAKERREAQNASSEASRALRSARAARELKKLEERFSEASGASALVSQRQEELAANPVTEDLLQRVLESEAEHRLAKARQETAAARLVVRRLGKTPVTADGVDLAEGEDREFSVLASLDVEVPGVVSVQVSPAAETTSLVAAVTESEDLLLAALRDAAVSSVQEAQERARARAAVLRSLEVAQQKLEGALGGGTLEDLQRSLAEARGRAQQIGESGTDSPVDLAQLERAVVEATEAHQAAEVRVVAADEVVEQKARAREELREKVSEHRLKVQKSQLGVQVHADRLAADRAARPDEDLIREKSGAEADAKELASRQAALLKELEDFKVARLEAELQNLEAGLVSRETEKKEAGERCIVLRTLVDEGAKNGSYDRVQEAVAAQQEADAAHQRVLRRAGAARLLHQTLQKHKSLAQERYVGPFARRLSQLGEYVFGPGFKVQVSPSLEVEGRTLGGTTVGFKSLSAGAKEQISLLGRLATAQLVDLEDGAPVILDDTLGYADSKRLADLNLVINSVGDSAQIIILTCQPNRFENVGRAKRVNL